MTRYQDALSAALRVRERFPDIVTVKELDPHGHRGNIAVLVKKKRFSGCEHPEQEKNRFDGAVGSVRAWYDFYHRPKYAEWSCGHADDGFSAVLHWGGIHGGELQGEEK